MSVTVATIGGMVSANHPLTVARTRALAVGEAFVTGASVSLNETRACRLAAACLADPAVREAEVTVHKPQAPIPFPFDDVAVTIRRARA